MGSILIKNGTIVTADQKYQADILVEEAKISGIGLHLKEDLKDCSMIEAEGKMIFPGGIDAHVHFALPTPAGPSCDDFLSGSRAALAGGTTYFIDFVTPYQGQSLKDALQLRQAEASNSLTECSLHMGITWFDETIRAQMEWCVKEAGIRSFKVYLAYKGNIGIEYHELEQVMIAAAGLNALVLVHCEEGDLILQKQQEFLKQGKTAPLYHTLSRPPETEAESVRKVIDLCRKTGCKTYIVHTSSAKSLEYIRQGKKEGLPVYCETCPQYLLLDESVYHKPLPDSLKYVISPPIRSTADQNALWLAIEDGTVDVLSTDHCPFNTFGQKDKGINDFTKIPNGAGGVEHRLKLIYTYGVLTGKISLQQFVALTSTNAAKIFGIYPRKGEIAVGSDADLVMWDPESTSVISAATNVQTCDEDIYEGMEIFGKPNMTLISGRLL
ncbi:MAG: dihydropyrimidinase [Bacteroidetes bacterium]|nr:MAG: dihydropyrimidinase [Bacteroidota bacterium]